MAILSQKLCLILLIAVDEDSLSQLIFADICDREAFESRAFTLSARFRDLPNSLLQQVRIAEVNQRGV